MYKIYLLGAYAHGICTRTGVGKWRAQLFLIRSLFSLTFNFWIYKTWATAIKIS